MILWGGDDTAPPRPMTTGERWLAAIALGATFLLACLALAGFLG